MQKLVFPAMKSLDQMRSLAGSGRNLAFSSRQQPHDSVSSGNFSNLKSTAEKLVKEQASMKSDLELANSKLRKSMDHVVALEEKLQNAFNENAKLRVMQKEDEKLWRGMESKFSSTKTLCDQLTETLQHLASQVQEAEKDKELFESKFFTSAEVIDSLKQQKEDLSSRLGVAEENIKSRKLLVCFRHVLLIFIHGSNIEVKHAGEKELEELKLEKEQTENSYLNEQCRTASLLKEKDATIVNSEVAIAEAKLNIGNLNLQLEKVRVELTSKEDEAKYLVGVKEKLERDKMDIQLSADNLSQKLINSDQEVKKLEGFVHSLATELAELDKKNLAFVENFDKLNGLYGTHLMLLQKDRDIASDRAQRLYNQLQGEFSTVTVQKEALQSSANELYEQKEELKKAKESLVSQLAEERCSAKQEIEKLESEAKCLVSTNSETEAVLSELKEELEALSENLRASENKTQELLLKLSTSEAESKENYEKLQILQKESDSNQLRLDLLSKEVNQLHSVIEEKELLINQYKENEKKLDQKTTEDKELLAAAETKLLEAKKQYDLMLENKQMELSRHLKELSQRNDQAINEIRRKYDEEKQEIIKAENEKVEKVFKELSTKYDKEISDCKAESKHQLLTIQEDHASLILTIREEHENREFNLKAKHDEELRQAQIQAETELKERITTIRNEHDAQLKAFKCQYEDDCKKLQDELDLQRSKVSVYQIHYRMHLLRLKRTDVDELSLQEERQRALLQMQWRVMSDKAPEEQEVSSKKEYSVSSVKVRGSRPPVSRKRQHTTVMLDDDEQDSPFVKEAETPVPKMLRKVENTNTRSIMSSQKQHSKVTRREHEAEAKDGRTTKRRKTKGTFMFEEPQRRTTRFTPRAKTTPRSIAKVAAISSHPPRSANIGDLFSEGSLNPYADDPYAFD
ncbi:hypothetical protein Bca52824_084862 [Brassica carinata]|uniref:Synaptonemal complex protein 1 n=1 Tax=Brassica carinata TaxID=52824 RepID=A0A8X7PMV2_BRACI|nr:hypothetical protein Bca52824_084862 [Brassica carinata]